MIYSSHYASVEKPPNSAVENVMELTLGSKTARRLSYKKAKLKIILD